MLTVLNPCLHTPPPPLSRTVVLTRIHHALRHERSNDYLPFWTWYAAPESLLLPMCGAATTNAN